MILDPTFGAALLQFTLWFPLLGAIVVAWPCSCGSGVEWPGSSPPRYRPWKVRKYMRNV